MSGLQNGSLTMTIDFLNCTNMSKGCLVCGVLQRETDCNALLQVQKNKRTCLAHENITCYLKNHWTKHGHVCTHFDAFSMLIPNMDMTRNNSKIFENFIIQ